MASNLAGVGQFHALSHAKELCFCHPVRITSAFADNMSIIHSRILLLSRHNLDPDDSQAQQNSSSSTSQRRSR